MVTRLAPWGGPLSLFPAQYGNKTQPVIVNATSGSVGISTTIGIHFGLLLLIGRFFNGTS